MATAVARPLPPSIQELILARIPILPLCFSARFVCKQWYHITKTGSFAKMWEEQSRKRGESYPFVVVAVGRYTLVIDPGHHMSPNITFMLKGQFVANSCKPEDGPWGERLVDSSGGLLLFFEQPDKLTVANPVLKQRKLLPAAPVSGILSSVVMDTREDKSYQVVVVGVLESDPEKGYLDKTTIVGFESTVKYYETYVNVYDSSTGSWSHTRSNQPQLKPFWFGANISRIIYNNKLYCRSPCMGEVHCFDLDLMCWEEGTIKVPPGTSLKWLSRYQGRLLAVLESPGDLTPQHWKRRSLQTLKLAFLDVSSLEWEVLDEIPRQQLVPKDGFVMDIWGYESKFVLMIAKSQAPGGLFADMHSGRCVFRLYDIESKQGVQVLEDGLPFGMFVSDFLDTPRAVFRPSFFAIP